MRWWISKFGVAAAALFLLSISSLGADPPDLSVAAQHATKAKALFDEGFYELLRRGNRVEAEARFNHAIRENLRAAELNPDLEQAFRQLARVYHVQKRYDEEIGAQQEILRLRPDDVDVRVRLADALIREHRLHEALEQFRAAQGYTNDPDTLERIGRYIESLEEHL
jgi:tetratricopeptide (TPR) repeat protein